MSKDKKVYLIFATVIGLCLITGLCSLLFGSVGLSFSRINAGISGTDSVASIILLDLRLPRLMGAFLAGVGLAVAGMLLQTVTNNDLCAPNVIGVNAGAGLLVMLTLCLAPQLWRLLPITAFCGSLFTTLIVLNVSRLSENYRQKSSIVLAGVAVSSLMNAGIAFLSIKYPEVLSSYTAFSVGGFYGVQKHQLFLPAVIIAILFALSVTIAPKIHILCLGDEVAASLGVKVKTIRVAVVIIASGLCASVVSFAGLLGFVGLIVPHMVRYIFPYNLRLQLVLTALVGALLVMLSDFLGRVLFVPWELPAGIIMAFIGAPFFLYLILRRRK